MTVFIPTTLRQFRVPSILFTFLFVACTNIQLLPNPGLEASDPLTRPIDQIQYWEDDIALFEAADIQSPPPKDAIVFIGSSSIVFWATLKRDMAPLDIIQRGFGGSKIYEALHYADRIVWPYEPRAIVMFSGSNDLAEPLPKSPDDVVQGFIDFVVETREQLPGVDIHYISITPTRARWPMQPLVAETNSRIAEICARDEKLFFIDTAVLTMKDGAPLDALFRDDGLHLNEAGYAVWTDLIRPHLLALYGESTSVR